MAAANVARTTTEVAEKPTSISMQVLHKIEDLQAAGELLLPPDYSARMALQSAQITLAELKTKNGQPVLQACTQTSIARALTNMVYMGLNPMKEQCYFIPYGDQLTLQVSYFGNMAIARRVDPTIKDITAQVIRDGDEVDVVIECGRTVVTRHARKWSAKPAPIIGVYCNVIYRDGHWVSTVMTMDEVQRSWQLGGAQTGSKAHKFTPEEMIKRTVIKRACKSIINQSDDASLLRRAVDEIEMQTVHTETKREIAAHSNVIDVEFPEPAGNGPAARTVDAAPAVTISEQTGEVLDTAPGENADEMEVPF